jgi:glycosyltransferase involved in cell wall biosynthesis
MNSDNLEIDLIINKKIIGQNPNVKYVIDNYREKIKNFYQFCLPFDYCYRGKPEKFSFKIAITIKRVFEFFDSWKVKKIIREGNYDFIYLNSLILHPLISEDFCFIIHVREIFDNSNTYAINSLSKAKGVIFIDEATQNPFKEIFIKNKIVLNNPFQMKRQIGTRLPNIPFNVDWKNRVIFSIIGRIEKVKGIPLVIESFKEVKNDNILLLIVGSGEEDYIDYCRNLAQNDNRIIFYGSEENIQIIYDISDYIIRGDPLQCIGRTIYEGLYSGCEVIVPGTNPYLFFEYQKFKDKVHFYQPTDILSLTKQIEVVSGRKITERQYYSNVHEYLEKFNEFITRACQEKTK